MSERATLTARKWAVRIVPFFVFVVLSGLYVAGGLEFLEFRLDDARFLLTERPASRSAVIVEIDPRSLKRLGVWPWPRGNHARAIENLTAAGARTIVLDVDFSSHSSPQQDERLQRAFESAGNVVLPVFDQWQRNGDRIELRETEPLARFVPAVRLASSNVIPSSDGLIRTMRRVHFMTGRVVPTIPEALAMADAVSDEGGYYIDYGIDPRTIPRLSFADVMAGNFDATAVRGRAVLIGATAVELGDVKSVPLYGMLPGVTVMALGYESIVQGRTLQRVPTAAALAGVALCLFFALGRFRRAGWRHGLMQIIAATMALFAGSWALQAMTAWVLDIAPIILALVFAFVLSLIFEIERQSFRILFQTIRLRRKDALMRTVVEHSFDGIVVTDANGVIESVNPSIVKTFGYDPTSLIGTHIAALFADFGIPKGGKGFPAMLPRDQKTREFRGRRADETLFHVETAVRPIRTDEGDRFAVFLRDISVQKHQERQLEFQAHHDPLTGLPNRLLLRDRMENAIRGAQRAGTRFAVLFLDLDHFKEVNDTLGHQVGDSLLRQVAERLSRSLRDCDTVSRLGGDEFAILLADVKNIEAARAVADKILAAVAHPYSIDDLSLDIAVSIGIALYPDHGDSIDLLFRRADVAMYTAKEHRNAIAVYEQETDHNTMRLLILSGDLRRAVDERSLQFAFQPKVSLIDGRCIGLEALSRWSHPELGTISPAEFVPLAERSGLINQFTVAVLEMTFTHLHAWRAEGHPVALAINVSMRNLHDYDFPDMVGKLLDRFGVDPSAITLEATESSMMTMPKRSLEVLSALAGLGLAISIDDFGAGQSSLRYLKDLPASEVKIDQSFVRAMGAEANSRKIVHSTIVLAHSLGLQVVAEGVEDAETLEQLRDFECDMAQGYYISEPMPPNAVPGWIARHSGILLPDPAAE